MSSIFTFTDSSDFAALPDSTPSMSWPPLLEFQFCVSLRIRNVGRPPSNASGLEVTASIWRLSPSAYMLSLPSCMPYLRRVSAGMRPGSSFIVFFVCSCETAHTCTQAFGSSRPTGSPLWSNRSKVRSAKQLATAPPAAIGSLPQPLSRCSTALSWTGTPCSSRL